MHPDRKIGIAMGILLIGVVGALFFRNEPLPLEEQTSLRRESELNERLRERDVSVYLDGATVGGEPAEEVTPVWTLEEVLGNQRRQTEAQPIVSMPAEPQPVVAQLDPTNFDPPSEDAVPLPRERGSYTEDGGTVGRVHQLTPDSHQVPVAAAAEVQNEPIGDDNFEEYSVQYGDTLSGISQKFLGSVSRYSEIYEINRDRIENPDSLRVGTALRIPRRVQ